jgi:hypothetical protein
MRKYNFLQKFSRSFGNSTFGTGRCSTTPTVISVTVSAEHTLKHLHETTEGILLTKPSMMLDIRTMPAVFILKQKYLYRPLDEVLYVCEDDPIHEQPYER